MSKTLWKTVLNDGLKQTTQQFNRQQLKVLSHLSRCRTEAAGVEIYACDDCGYQMQVLRSCRDRHCPNCQYRDTLKWCQARRNDVLPVNYYHLVFTLPAELNGWASCHAAVLYRLLFESVWHTLKSFGQAPKRLNGQLGAMAVLHTWGQTLARHIHLHCLVPGGALTEKGQWHRCHHKYLFPVKALSVHFRGRMVSALREAKNKGLLNRIDNELFSHTLEQLMAKPWVVYSKQAVYGHERLIDYLGRYTRRIALTPSRLVDYQEGCVRLKYHDYRDGQTKIMAMSPSELVRRFALHVLPKGFMRVRYYGFLANAVRAKNLTGIRRVLNVEEKRCVDNEIAPIGVPRCPDCGQKHWHYVGLLLRWHWQPG